jgi:phage/plasmid-associated DNA primase
MTNLNHFTHEQWRQDPLRCACVQLAWDARRESRRPGARVHEYDNDEIAALLEWDAGFDRHPDDGLLDDKQCAALIEAERTARERRVRDAKAQEQSKKPTANSQPAPSNIEFIKALFANTTGPVYTCSFTNERGAGPERHVVGRQQGHITRFVQNHDKPGRGTFFCVSTQQEGTGHRIKDNCKETNFLFADIDFKNVEMLGADPRSEVLRQLGRLKFLPSITVSSGGGVHGYWQFKEPLDTQANKERIEAALRQLADIVAGDLVVCEVARVMRLPGTHNSKTDEMRPVEIASFDPGRRYDLEELEEWLSEQSPVMLRVKRERGKTVGEADNDVFKFFEDYAKRFGIKPPIDVEARLRGMMFMGPGDSSIHQTQLAVTASLLSRGASKDEVVPYVLHYTKLAAGDYGKRWNWRREERGIERMCDDWLKKHPQEKPKPAKPTPTLVKTDAAVEQKSDPSKPVAGAKPDGNVVKMPIITPAAPKPNELHIAVGKAVLAHMQDQGDELINNRDAAWLYAQGVWEFRNDINAYLNMRIERQCAASGLKSTTKLITETRNWILRQPHLWRNDISWDQHGKIPTRSGLIDPLTGELEPARADHFCTWRVECDYDPNAICPWWETMISDMFGDKPEPERDALVGVVQELMGAALIDKKPRALSKACVFWGIENRAKSGALDVVTGLFGGNPISAPIDTVDSTHGLMPFARRAPWVLHEAFGGKWHLSATVKSIVTGDAVQINIKNGPMLTQIVRAPIFWGTNFQPQFKETTRAIVSRMMIIEVTRAFIESKPIGAAAEAIKRGFAKPGEFIVATELPGVLNWAIAGLKRALERGSIASTDGIAETGKAIHQDSNLVAGFLEDCIEFDPMARLKTTDFCLAHSAWWMELKGEDRRLPTNEAIGKALKAMGDPRIGMNRKEMRDGANRYYCGIALNKSGLRYHKAAFESKLFEGKIATATAPDREVNSLIPPSWDDRPSITSMRNGHNEGVNGHTNGSAPASGR